MGHLQRFFAKMTNARQTPGGGGWAAMELIETLLIYTKPELTLFILDSSVIPIGYTVLP